ncbi:MAG TPA: glycosyltransferase [Candidatus Acidoferrales bacterium]|nr:glycosyltransferase [Candidatus Acidoferrales bacterium]
MQSGAALGARAARQTSAQPDEQLHRQGIQLFQAGKLTDALTFIARSLGARETAERWNDWATVQSALGSPQDAEQGFRRALALSPNHAQAAANLGALIAAASRFEEAIPLLEKGAAGVDQSQRIAFTQILEDARASLSAGAALNEDEIAAFLQAQLARATTGAMHSETVAYCAALLKQIPQAVPGQRVLVIGAHGDLLAPALKHFHSFHQITQLSLAGLSHPSANAKEKSKNTVILSEAKDPSSIFVNEAAISMSGKTSSSLSPEPAPSARHNLAQRVSAGYAAPNSRSAVGGAQKFEHAAFENSSFDVAVLSQVLESIADDPMRVFAEINRVLKPGGMLVLSASNIASARSLHTLLRGGTPYVDGRFSPGGEAAHHREYTASEVEALARAGGFGQIRTLTRDIVWKSLDALMASLAASGFSVAARGDTILMTARKESAVRDRFPPKLYDLSSVQSSMATVGNNAPMRILLIFETLPLPEGGGADHRLLQIVRLLREQGHAVTFLAPRTAGNNLRSSVLTEMGIEFRLEDSDVLRLEGIDIVGKWTLQEVLREGQFDLAMISLWFWMGINLPEHYLDEIRRMSPATRVAILTDDYHGLREQGGAEISGLWSDRERAIDFTERELETYRRSDLVISISDSDRKKIARETGTIPIEVLPMMIEAQPTSINSVILSEAKDPSFSSIDRRHLADNELARAISPGFDQREGIVYLGHFNNPSTLDGLEWYIREVAPLVRKELPDLKLYVVGAQLPEAWSMPDPNVIRVGFKPDLAAEFAKYRILVSPVRFGTGIKTKNLHAIAHGLPIVTNTKGADGANFVSGETALIADDPQAFAAAVVKLYSNRELWEKLSKTSRAHAEKHFSKAAMDIALRTILDRARTIKPQPYDPSHVWSMRLVEAMFLEVSTYQPGRDRHAVRVLAYSRAAEHLLAQGNSAEARRQLRHVFNYFSHTVSRSIFFGGMVGVAEAMERTYRALGEIKGSEEFRCEARQFSATVFAETSAPPARSAELATAPAVVPQLSAKPAVSRNARKNAKLDFSVVIPTFNRVDVLADCLGALNRQSLSPHRFEVIVVDDGSVDGTSELCARHKPRHDFHYLQQKNGGAGAARRLGVECARSKYLLLINDDTIAGRDLLAQHLELQRAHANQKIAILGHFKYPEAAKKRALTWFLSSQPFLFPQVGLKPGIYTNHSFFITCNISVRRDLVLAAGSFDANFRVGEDTELGVRLTRKGLKVIYAPEIEAIHDHLDFRLADLIGRAQFYGKTLVKLFKKHPDLLADGEGVLGTLDGNSIRKIDSFIVEHEAEIPAAMESLAKFDSIDFLPFFSKELDGKNAADTVMELFTRSIPAVYWYHLFKSFLAARDADTNFTSTSANRNLIAQRADA